MTTTRAQRVSRVWSLSTRPPCFDSPEAWADWLEARASAQAAPCEDCSPAFKRQAMARDKCIRPETVFLHGTDGEFGVCADDPRFARLLLGLKIAGADSQPAIEPTDRWRRLLELIERRAHGSVRHAIGMWMRKNRRKE